MIESNASKPNRNMLLAIQTMLSIQTTLEMPRSVVQLTIDILYKHRKLVLVDHATFLFQSYIEGSVGREKITRKNVNLSRIEVQPLALQTRG